MRARVCVYLILLYRNNLIALTCFALIKYCLHMPYDINTYINLYIYFLELVVSIILVAVTLIMVVSITWRVKCNVPSDKSTLIYFLFCIEKCHDVFTVEQYFF